MISEITRPVLRDEGPSGSVAAKPAARDDVEKQQHRTHSKSAARFQARFLRADNRAHAPATPPTLPVDRSVSELIVSSCLWIRACLPDFETIRTARRPGSQRAGRNSLVGTVAPAFRFEPQRPGTGRGPSTAH